MMARFRAKDTRPELLVRRALHARGYRFRLHRRDLPGTPDIVLPRHRKVVLVHGCFWHHHEGCRTAKVPASREDFWRAKFQANKDRDLRNLSDLRSQGWHVVVIWECEARQGTLGTVLDRSGLPDRASASS